MSNIIIIDDNEEKLELHNNNSSDDEDEDEHFNWNQTKPDRALLQKHKGVRSLFIVPGSTSSAQLSSSSAIVRPPRFINFTQILINRNKKYRNGEMNLNKNNDKRNGKSAFSISTTISPINNIKKKFIRLSSTTVSPSILKPGKNSKLTNLAKANTAIASKPNKKKTLVKVKVKSGDQQLLLYDHHKLKSSSQRNATTTSTATTITTTTTSTVLPSKPTTMSLAEITRTRELNRKKKQENSGDHFLDTSTTMNPLEEDTISTLFSSTDVMNGTNVELNTEPFSSDYSTPFPINMTETETVL